MLEHPSVLGDGDLLAGHRDRVQPTPTAAAGPAVV